MANKNPDTMTGIQSSMALQNEGRLEEAIAVLEGLVKRHPKDADVVSFLGAAKARAKDPMLGEQLTRKAVTLDPGNANCRYNLAFVLAQTGRLQESLDELKQGIRLKPKDPTILQALAQSYFRLERWTKSANCWEKLSKIEPNNPQVLFEWTRPLIKQRNYKKADEVFRELLSRTEPTAETLYIAGHINLMKRDLKSAVNFLDRSLKIKPGYSPALVDKARALVFQGDLAKAKPLFEKGLEADPRNIEAYLHYTEAFPGEIDDGVLKRLKELADKQKKPSSSFANASFALGGMYRAKQEYATAFAHYRAANDTMAKLLTRQGLGYDAKPEEQKFQALKARFPALESFVRDNGRVTPLFIVGMPRSGTSLVETILSSHSKVRAAGEHDEMRNQYAEVERRALENPKVEFRTILKGYAKQAADAYLASLPKLKVGENFVTDKLPDNFLFIGLIAATLKGAKIINMKRDLRDTGLSLYTHNFGSGYPYTTRLEDIAHYAGLYRDLMDHWRSLTAQKILDVRYEALVEAPRQEVGKILDFCGLKWEDACLEFYKNPAAMITMSAAQVRKPLNEDSIGRWQNYRNELKPLIDGLGLPRGE